MIIKIENVCYAIKHVKDAGVHMLINVWDVSLEELIKGNAKKVNAVLSINKTAL